MGGGAVLVSWCVPEIAQGVAIALSMKRLPPGVGSAVWATPSKVPERPRGNFSVELTAIMPNLTQQFMAGTPVGPDMCRLEVHDAFALPTDAITGVLYRRLDSHQVAKAKRGVLMSTIRHSFDAALTAAPQQLLLHRLPFPPPDVDAVGGRRAGGSGSIDGGGGASSSVAFVPPSTASAPSCGTTVGTVGPMSSITHAAAAGALAPHVGMLRAPGFGGARPFPSPAAHGVRHAVPAHAPSSPHRVHPYATSHGPASHAYAAQGMPLVAYGPYPPPSPPQQHRRMHTTPRMRCHSTDHMLLQAPPRRTLLQAPPRRTPTAITPPVRLPNPPPARAKCASTSGQIDSDMAVHYMPRSPARSSRIRGVTRMAAGA